MNKFDRAQQPKMFDTEEWGENDKGCFSLRSGRFIPKADENYSNLDKDIIFPGNLRPEVADEKKEKY